MRGPSWGAQAADAPPAPATAPTPVSMAGAPDFDPAGRQVGGASSVDRVDQCRVYRPDERPDVEVLVDGVWCDGELRLWTQREDGQSYAMPTR